MMHLFSFLLFSFSFCSLHLFSFHLFSFLLFSFIHNYRKKKKKRKMRNDVSPNRKCLKANPKTKVKAKAKAKATTPSQSPYPSPSPSSSPSPSPSSSSSSSSSPTPQLSPSLSPADVAEPIYPFEDEDVLNLQTVEEITLEYLFLEFPDYEWKVSKQMAKPMLLLDLESHVVIVEIDRNAEVLADRQRLMRMTLYKPIVYIRFNPTAYIGESRWDEDWNRDRGQNGMSDIDAWYMRLGVLRDEIDLRLRNQPLQSFTSVSMYYETPIAISEVINSYPGTLR
jgi:hypothetical protein